MNENATFRIEILAPTGFADELESMAEEAESGMEIVERHKVDEATQRSLLLADVASVITLVTASVYFGELAVRIYRYLKARKNHRIRIRTPAGIAELSYSEDLSEEEVKQILEKALEAYTP